MKDVYYAFSSEFGSFVGESKFAKELDKYLFYDEDKDIFFDKDGNEVDVAGYNILPRTGVYQAEKLVDAIYKHGAMSIVKQDDFQKTMDWPKYISTKRHNIIMSGQEILDNGAKIIEEFGSGSVFFKTKEKNYSNIISVESLLKKNGNFYDALQAHKDDDFIISDVVDIIEDEFGRLEYRVFVLDGKVLNISRVHGYLVEQIPLGVVNYVNEVVSSVTSADFPQTFVVDVFACEDSNGKQFLDVLECNPFVASGTYLYNSVFGRKGNLDHTLDGATIFDTIPDEKLKFGHREKYTVDSKLQGHPSVCYELAGGFAADLISFATLGTSSKGFYIHIDTVGSVNVNKQEPLSSIKIIENDDDMNGNSLQSDANSLLVSDLKKLIKRNDETSNS